MIVRDYELFSMKQNESIIDIFTCFTNILNSLKANSKKYFLSEQNMKILYDLPKSYKPKSLAIEKLKDLKTLSVEALIGSLLTRKMKLKRFDENGDGEGIKKGCIKSQ